MTQIAIHSAEDLFIFMAFAGEDRRLWDAVDLERLKVVIPVSVAGPTRDGRIDSFGARFVSDLQKQVHQAFKLAGATTGGRKNQLRVAVKDGCDWKDIDLTAVTKEAIKKLSGKQIVTTICIIGALATGAICYGHFKDENIERIRADVDRYRIEVAARDQQYQREHEERLIGQLSKTNQEILQEAMALARDVASKEVAEGRDPHKPVRRFVKSIRRGETIKAAGGEGLSKGVALEKLTPPPSADDLFYVHADGPYNLLGIDLLENAQGLRIGHDGQDTTALLERLDENLRRETVAKVDESMEQKTIVDMDLQLDVYFTNKKIHHAVVIGIGPPRRGLRHFSFEDIPGHIPDDQRMRQGQGQDQ